MHRKIHTFRAATMDDALDLVRRELGQDVVVVDSKKVDVRRLLPWPSSRQEIEVSVEHVLRPSNSRPAPILEKVSTAGNRTVRTLAETRSQPMPQDLLAPIPALNSEDVDDRRIDFGQVSLLSTSPSPDGRPSSTNSRANLAGTEPNSVDYGKTLQSLQAIVAQLERQSQTRAESAVPNELYPHYRMLVEADIDDDVARNLVGKIRQYATSDLTSSPTAVAATMTALIEREMRCAPPIQPKPGHRQIVTLVGPTGVGKTTTLAKLAGHFHLREGLRVGLITVDGYRVGAVEQLQTYADILQIPLRIATNPTELQAAIDELDDVDLILIDTAGRSPLDGSKMNELRDIIRAAGSDHVLLVLSLASGARMLSKIADQFAVALPTSLVLTKLDETLGGADLLSVAREIVHPVSYLTTGQDVPDQFEPAHPNRLARLILGRDQIHQPAIP